MKRRADALLLLAGLLAGGCIRTSEIRPSSLASLDGYAVDEVGHARRVETIQGDQVGFKSGSVLELELPADRVGGRFASISVHDGVFLGQTVDGRKVEAPMAQIRAAEVSRHDPSGTIFILLAVAAVLGGAGFLLANRDHSMAVPGRALRVAGRAVVAPPSTQDGWTDGAAAPDLSSLTPRAREALAKHWTESALAEHASVPAFSRLSLTLMAFGAPSELVESAHRAALDEIEHARLSSALAGGYAGRAFAPGPLEALRSAPATTATTLEGLAAESLVDGCYLEGVAAAVAEESGRRSTDGAVREALAVIARDELSHAELAWRVVTWCCAVGGPPLVRHVRKLAHQLPALAAQPALPPEMHAELVAHGWLPASAWRAAGDRVRVTLAARTAELHRS